jgi:tetratricopeptide (TPR) repeat protein/Zn finger protein HypA/HybF involved in hydrogenase expression
MISLRYLAVLLVACSIWPAAGKDAGSDYVGSAACYSCHPARLKSQSNSAHAHALRRAQLTDPGPGSHAQWAFGAGVKAMTWVSQTGEETIAEHGLSYYTATKSLALTPGHARPTDTVYRTFDPVGTALRCFRCHSTGPVKLTADFQIQPSEPGVYCESCHGPGRAHVESAGARAIQNPKRLTAVQINTLCGACHRQASDLDDNTDWSNSWNVRHQPRYLHRSACFRNSNGALSCLTCHDPHQPVKAASFYEAKCVSCHSKTQHTIQVASRTCVGCHMPQVATSANLKFTNHWIGIYNPRGPNLIPSKRTVKDLRPASGKEESTDGVIVPGDASTLVPIYAQAVSERERESGPNSPKVGRALSDLGLFLLEIGNAAAAEAPFRRAVSIAEGNSDPAIDAACEGLGRALEAQGKRDEALGLFRRAAAGRDLKIAARSFAKLAEFDPEHADTYYPNGIASEEKASGADSPMVAILLHDYAQVLRAQDRDPEAEPLLRRALSIQQAAKADARVTIGILNMLGNLLEGRQQLDEAERLERTALALSEEKFGPESSQLATTCTNLADVLWNRKNLREAGLLYRRAISIDTSLYGPDRPETAADIANLGMLMKEAGQSAAGDDLLRKALAIYEQAAGSNSDEARFIRERLAKSDR